MIAKDCTETRLSGVALSIGVINALRVKWPERVFFSDTPRHRNALSEIDRDCVGRRRTGTRQGNVYLRVREKQGIVV